MSKAVFKVNEGFFKDLLHSDLVSDACEKLADQGVDYAREHAPFGDPAIDSHSGAYRDSIHKERHATDERVTWRIVADDPKAHLVEDGSQHNDAYRTLGRTADHLKQR